MESRTPPKFVPTLTEVAVQEATPVPEPIFDQNTDLARDHQAREAIDLIANDTPPNPGADVLRRRREQGSEVDAVPLPVIDIANLPTHSGWAQPVDGLVLPVGVESLAQVAQADHIDTDSLAEVVTQHVLPDLSSPAPTVPAPTIPKPTIPTPVPTAQALHTQVTHVEGVVDVLPAQASSDAVTASLVASAAQTAQELEEAITRRVLKRVQETLDARLTRAVLQVVDQQTALLQSSLQLELDATIRDAVAEAVSKVLGEQSDDT